MSSGSSSNWPWGWTETAVLALGSNLGDPVQNVRQAMEVLAGWSPDPVWKSSLWISTPLDCPEGSPDFVNAVVVLHTAEGDQAETWLSRAQEMEILVGRRPKVVLNEPRPLDVDLIFFRSEISKDPRLILPHPRATQRRFVLAPLAEGFAEAVLPGWDRSVQSLLEDLPPDPGLRRLSHR